MSHAFEGHNEAELDATPEQVWQAIATGPGIDSWYMGRNEVDPRVGGAVRTFFGAFTPTSKITAWEPNKHLVHRTDAAADGRFIAFEYLIEGREGGSTVLRMVVSGFIPGDDWEQEYDASTKGGEMYFNTLVSYLTHFAGRTATPVIAYGPQVADWDRTWSALHAALGLTTPPAEGDKVQVAPAGLPLIDGVVDFVNRDHLGVRTSDALYRFSQGFFHKAVIVDHHIFAPGVEPDQAEQAWQAWLTTISETVRSR